MKNQDTYSPNGYLEIYKLYPSGKEEMVFSEKNTITSGMGIGLSRMFSASSNQPITDFQIRFFQVGYESPDYSVSTNKLSSALEINDYGASPDVITSTLNQYAGTTLLTNKAFVEIPFNLIKRVNKNSVQFSLFLGQNTANDLPTTLKEIGLFMKNPLQLSPIAPILVAYKTFPEIDKTSEFSLIFRWTLTF
jgi:hypothetical protein